MLLGLCLACGPSGDVTSINNAQHLTHPYLLPGLLPGQQMCAAALWLLRAVTDGRQAADFVYVWPDSLAQILMATAAAMCGLHFYVYDACCNLSAAPWQLLQLLLAHVPAAAVAPTAALLQQLPLQPAPASCLRPSLCQPVSRKVHNDKASSGSTLGDAVSQYRFHYRSRAEPARARMVRLCSTSYTCVSMNMRKLQPANSWCAADDAQDATSGRKCRYEQILSNMFRTLSNEPSWRDIQCDTCVCGTCRQTIDF
jgi:hypothetical protein